MQDITYLGVTGLGCVCFGVSNLNEWRTFASKILAPPVVAAMLSLSKE
jgi:hypothetical protein